MIDQLMAVLPQNQLLFNLNPVMSSAALPTRLHPPEPIVINKFDSVSYAHFLCTLVHVCILRNCYLFNLF